MELFFDTETTGIPRNYNAPVSDTDNWPRLVQLGFILVNQKEILIEQEYIVKPSGFDIPVEASNVHGITTEQARMTGIPVQEVLEDFKHYISISDAVVGHNISYDIGVVGAEFFRLWKTNLFEGVRTICTMKSSVAFCKLPGGKPYKWPKLHELYRKLFDKDMGAAHTALQDIQNTVVCYHALVERGIIA